QRAIARIFSLCGVMGSRLIACVGDTQEECDADSWRKDAEKQGRYRADIAAQTPWNTRMGDVVPYAQDARFAVLGGVTVDEAMILRVNSKLFSHEKAHPLEPGVFAYAATIRSVSDVEEAIREVPDEFAAAWTLKPHLGFAGGGRIAGRG